MSWDCNPLWVNRGYLTVSTAGILAILPYLFVVGQVPFSAAQELFKPKLDVMYTL